MAKKGGGGLKQNLVWIVIIGALGLLAYLTLAGGNSGSKTATLTDKSGGSVAAEKTSNPKSSAQAAPSGGGSAGSNSQGASGPNSSYNYNPKSGGTLGGSYLLKNLSASKGTGYESANIFVKSVSGSAGLPKYSATINGNIIDVSLQDTRNFDIDVGANSYSGNNPLQVNYKAIQSIQWIAQGESNLTIRITLKNKAPFTIVNLSNPSAIEVRVAI